MVRQPAGRCLDSGAANVFSVLTDLYLVSVCGGIFPASYIRRLSETANSQESVLQLQSPDILLGLAVYDVSAPRTDPGPHDPVHSAADARAGVDRITGRGAVVVAGVHAEALLKKKRIR